VCRCNHLTDFAASFKETIANATVVNPGNVHNLGKVQHRFGTLIACASIIGLGVVFYIIGKRWDEKSEAEQPKDAPRPDADGFFAEDRPVNAKGDVEMQQMRKSKRFSLRKDPDAPRPPPKTFIEHISSIWQKIKRNHLIIGYLFRRPNDVFTRPARVLCICCILLGELAVNAAFYDVRNNSMSSTAVTGLVSAIIIFPVSFFLPVFFRTFRGQPGLKVCGHRVPSWTRRLPYYLTIGLTIFFGYIVILYGVSFSKLAQTNWLLSSLWSIVQDIFAQEPVQAFIRESGLYWLMQVLH